MAKLATRGKLVSDVLAFESKLEHGYCRETVTVTVEAGMDIGAVLALKAGKYVWVNAAEVTASVPNGVAVLLQGTAGLNVGDNLLAVLVNGEAGITPAGLVYKGVVTAPDQATVLAKFKAQGIKARTRV